MSAAEVVWRLSQKGLQAAERLRYGRRRRPIDHPLYRGAAKVEFNPAPLGLVADGPHTIDTSHSIHPLGGFDYAAFATDWHAGFQTAAHWPLQWSYSLDYKQRDDIGDARTNWELNRLGQFALMAKAYYLTADPAHLDTLRSQLDSWTRCNPFLWGISWTSPMEVALRAINWLYAAAFLKAACADEGSAEADALAGRLATGAFNMVSYLTRHYSRGSSANNHLLVEMAAVYLGGACFSREKWCRLAAETLSRELPRQFAADGVNLEMSLHYHAFAMEAYLLVMHSMRATGAEIPAPWSAMMAKAAGFVAHSRVAPGVFCEFGDNDEGHILNFSSRKADYYTYILQFSSLILNRRYDSFDTLNPTLAWLCPAGEVARVKSLPLIDTSQSHTYAEGGYTFLRSGDIFVGFDHAALGFGSIAAHGHADALSVQVFIGGRPLLADPGTYIYHCDLPSRNKFRTSAMHCTASFGHAEQSEMLGAFLWGRRAETRLLRHSATMAEASTTGLSGVTHTRRVEVSPEGVDITDSASGNTGNWMENFILAPDVEVRPISDVGFDLGDLARLTVDGGKYCRDTVDFSPEYGVKVPTERLQFEVSGGDTVKFHIRKTHKS